MGVDRQKILDLIESGDTEVWHPFDTTTVVAIKLPNGFVVHGASSCLDPGSYDPVIGANIATEKIIDKLTTLEAYSFLEETNED